MRKINLLFFILLCLVNETYCQTPYNPFINNIHYDPEPSAFGFECGTLNHIKFTGGITTISDATQWQTQPLKISICVEGFTFYGPAATSISGNYASNFDWVYDSINPNCVIGTQNKTLPGTGSDPLSPDTLSSGVIAADLIASSNSPQGNILKVTAMLIIPPYMLAFNSIGDDIEISQTQTFFDGYTLSSAGSISGSKIFCVNGDADEFISITPAAGGQSGNFYYQWQELIDPNWIDIPGATNLTYDAPGTFISKYYRRRAKGTLCDNWLSTDSVSVIIDSLPIIGVNAGSNTFLNCSITSTTIGSLPVIGHTYAWLPVTGLSDDAIAQPIANPAVTTTYTLQVVDSNQCVATDTIRIVVNNTSQTVFAGSDKTLTCSLTSTLIGPAHEPTSTYSWSPQNNLNASNIGQPLANPSVTTTYTLSVIDSNGCSSIDEVTVFVNNIAQGGTAGLDKNLNCSVSSVMIGMPAVAGTTYTWSPSLGLNSVNIPQPIANPSTTTTYTINIVDSNGCVASDEMVVNVDTTPPNSNAGQDKLLTCDSLSTEIGSLAISGYTYSWSPAQSLSSSNIAQPIASPLVATTYTVTVTGSNGCSASDMVTVNIDNTPPLADAGNSQTICAGNSIGIGSVNILGNTYSWSPSSGLNSSTVAEPIANPTSFTTYTVSVKALNGCVATDTVSIKVNSCLVDIFGTVYHDTNSLTNLNVDGIGINNPNGVLLHANLNDLNGFVLRTTPVAPDGTYQILNVQTNKDYEMRLSTIQGVQGNVSPPCNLPSNWACTGEDCCDKLGDDGQPDGSNYFHVEETNKTYIDFGIMNNTPLPLVLKNFFVSEYNCNSLLSFITSQELNTSHVDIYRRDGIRQVFNKIGTIQSAGNSEVENVYSFLDQNVVKDVNYEYQLKFIDIDGKSSLSPVNTLQLTCETEKITKVNLFPNPAQNELNILLMTEIDNTELQIEVVDVAGRISKTHSHQIKGGANLITLNISSLVNGVYILHYKDLDGTLIGSERFIKN